MQSIMGSGDPVRVLGSCPPSLSGSECKCAWIQVYSEPSCRLCIHIQSDHLSGKPGNVREFETCQGNVRDNVNSRGIVREESGKNYCQGKLARLGVKWKNFLGSLTLAITPLNKSVNFYGYPAENSAQEHIYIVIAAFVIMMNLIVWLFALTLVLKACY